MRNRPADLGPILLVGLIAALGGRSEQGSPGERGPAALGERLLAAEQGPRATTARALGGGLRLETNVPPLARTCPRSNVASLECRDADGDGLVDAWEEYLLEHMRPVVRFDEDEPWLEDDDAHMAQIGRVFMARREPLRVRMLLVIAYHRDYGSFCGGLSSHAGDPERIALELERVPSHGQGDVRMRRVYTAAHEHTRNDHSRILRRRQLSGLTLTPHPTTGAPRWVVYASAGKHATYASARRCENVARGVPCFDEDCAPDGVADASNYDRLPRWVNAGEPDRPLVRDLDAWGFAGENAWAPGHFCGGIGGSNCTGPIRRKLVHDPFAAE